MFQEKSIIPLKHSGNYTHHLLKCLHFAQVVQWCGSCYSWKKQLLISENNVNNIVFVMKTRYLLLAGGCYLLNIVKINVIFSKVRYVFQINTEPLLIWWWILVHKGRNLLMNWIIIEFPITAQHHAVLIKLNSFQCLQQEKREDLSLKENVAFVESRDLTRQFSCSAWYQVPFLCKWKDGNYIWSALLLRFLPMKTRVHFFEMWFKGHIDLTSELQHVTTDRRFWITPCLSFTGILQIIE
jgi:hypothetical protein